jgi:hypothetical protein
MEATKVFVDNVCIDILNGSCYVTLFQAPLQVYKSYKKAIPTLTDMSIFKGMSVRFGAYGDLTQFN